MKQHDGTHVTEDHAARETAAGRIDTAITHMKGQSQ